MKNIFLFNCICLTLLSTQHLASADTENTLPSTQICTSLLLSIMTHTYDADEKSIRFTSQNNTETISLSTLQKTLHNLHRVHAALHTNHDPDGTFDEQLRSMTDVFSRSGLFAQFSNSLKQLKENAHEKNVTPEQQELIELIAFEGSAEGSLLSLSTKFCREYLVLNKEIRRNNWQNLREKKHPALQEAVILQAIADEKETLLTNLSAQLKESVSAEHYTSWCAVL